MNSYMTSLLVITISLICCVTLTRADVERIRMPNVKPPTEDYYVCTSHHVDREKYITQYEAIANAGTAHHILMFACEEPFSTQPTWQCGPTCGRGKNSIMFAWARNAPPTKLPKDVGFHVGGDSGYNTIVMQVHYARVLNESEPADQSGIAITTTDVKPKYSQGIFLMAAYSGTIPPHSPSSSLDVSCRFPGTTPIHAFAFRTHAHTLSTVISAYRKPANEPSAEWEQLGKGNPQWPQAFYPMTTEHIIDPNDMVVARCVYNSSQRDTATAIGSTHMDEMCNFYTMFYTEGEAESLSCGLNRFPKIAASMPADSLVRLPPNAALDEIASGMHHHHSAPEEDEPPVESETKNEESGMTLMHEEEGWFNNPTTVKLGQIAGLDTDNDGNVVVFHRGSHTWDDHSFDGANNYQDRNKGPIIEKTLVKFGNTGNAMDFWGDNFFYLPHGITYDHEGNLWLTDVAMHQVFKFDSGERQTPSLILGEKFVPGDDESHFCKPTDVAVMPDGTFFVSDGYCNGRIIHYNKDGQVIRKWGQQQARLRVISSIRNEFNTVHSLALSPTLNLLCAADRQNERIQCFDLEGQFKYQVKLEHSVYAIAFKGKTDKLVAVEVEQSETGSGRGCLFQMSSSSAKLLEHFQPAGESFDLVHDIAVSNDGKEAYVSRLNSPPKVWKFTFSNDDTDTDAVVEDVKEATKKTDTVSATLVKKVSKPDNSKDDEIGANNGETVSQKVPIIVGVMLIVPIVCVLIILLGFKIYNARKSRNTHGNFDMGSMFRSNSKRRDMAGFAPLTAQEDHYTESEDELLNNEKSRIIHQ